ncbi:alpha-ketoglutarate-dependent dioxygenase AlkB [Chryseobacterium wangxinyae]|uniref:alpha-ketoglutarate-dependent dioxygenase AlkB family protein n=1 Tax=Chryseobacterium sp. CY350 TaxID=2997336 RepID=UPI0022716D11|nr:alpha-ketoglutarate-dependent dioxygenase AlkB [Chryseobacterium sp. CY350]MCY0977068.1 alpha-ketoglutarate-dependent dioxygenase AlkB [Chryseobacterium sp. CY350]WBZ97066.1 alpha-ketoglutarate-dependent dioxygenase AlkB [Chryseobacterium sp. CY350]
MLNLFENIQNFPINILPKDGITEYYGKIFSDEECEQNYHYLFNEIPWENDEAVIFGKLILTKRKVAWFGEKPFEYTYSKRTKYAKIWTPELLQLKQKCEAVSGETYNSCLLNLYHDGSEGMAYHSDGEKDLKKHGAIASLTFGAERKFLFKHKTTKEKVELFLENGSLLVMKGETQDQWMHRLPPTTKVKTPRVNLTFRTIEE